MLILKNANIIHFYPLEIISKVDIVIESSTIQEIGKNIAAKYSGENMLDLHGKYVSPGIVCAHNHFYSALARGILADIPPSKDFVSILKNLWWRLDRALDESSVYSSGLIGALEAIKAGTTAVIDHHASPSFIKGSLNTLKNAFEKTGLRGVLAYEITDRNGEERMRAGVEESLEFIKSVELGKGNSLVEAAIGGHSPFTLGNPALELMKEALRQTGRGIHLHVAEDQFDPSFSHYYYGMDLLERLDKFDLLNEKSILVHGVYLSEKDIEILNEHNAFLIHNPRSNMNNGVGYMNKLQQVKNLALGTDGIGSNMFEELKFAYFKNAEEKGRLGANDFLRSLQNGNVILERYFGGKFGKVEQGYTADLVIYDYQAPTPLTAENLAGHLLFGFSSRDVETVIVNGTIAYRDRQFPFDIGDIYREAQLQARELWERINKISP